MAWGAMMSLNVFGESRKVIWRLMQDKIYSLEQDEHRELDEEKVL
jgi:hypothetical protein